LADRWGERLSTLIARARGRGGPARAARRRERAESAATQWRRTLQTRVVVTTAVFAAWGAGIEGRLVWLQVVQHAELMARAERQQMRTLDAAAERGEILDRNGHVLAYSVDAESVYAVPTEIKDPAAAAAQLCKVFEDCDARERSASSKRTAGTTPRRNSRHT
jgi:cell division protein FtsI (penicillin-binding protein 3)